MDSHPEPACPGRTRAPAAGDRWNGPLEPRRIARTILGGPGGRATRDKPARFSEVWSRPELLPRVGDRRSAGGRDALGCRLARRGAPEFLAGSLRRAVGISAPARNRGLAASDQTDVAVR